MKNFILGSVLFILAMFSVDYSLQAQLPAQVEQTAVAEIQSDQSPSFDMMDLDFSTPEKSKKSIAFLLSIALTIAIGYIPAVQQWASKAQNQKAIRIALAALPIVVVSLFFGGGFNITELLKVVIEAIGSAIFLHTVAVKPFSGKVESDEKELENEG